MVSTKKTSDFKPMLATDVDISKLSYPCIVQAKIDGVRALNVNGKLVGRSLKPFNNMYVTRLLSREEYAGFDGEIVCMKSYLSDRENCCRNTTSIMNTKSHDAVDIIWFIYDDFSNPEVPYKERLFNIQWRIKKLHAYEKKGVHHHIRFITLELPLLSDIDETDVLTRGYHIALSENDIENYSRKALDAKHEGLIIRGMNNPYKFGRSTQKEGGLLRLKEFCDAEAEVIGIVEGETNNNPAVINELGLTERSSHKENKVPNGKIGSLICFDLETQTEITVSAGKLTNEERIHYFQNQNEILGKVIKYKYFPSGGKDKPRFPTFQCFRIAEDMS